MISIDPECVISSGKEAEAYTCSICQCIAMLAVETKCGHVYCKACIDSWIKEKKKKKASAVPTCPVDQKALVSSGGGGTDYYTVSEFMRRQINNLRVKCPSSCNGGACKFTDTILSLLNEHIKKCTELKLTCTDCRQSDIPAKNMTRHNEKECKNRLMTCPQCGQPNIRPFEHESVCVNRVVACSHCKTRQVVWSKRSEHEAFECEAMKSVCSYCTQEVPNAVMFMHFQGGCPQEPRMCSVCHDIVSVSDRKTHLQTCSRPGTSAPVQTEMATQAQVTHDQELERKMLDDIKASLSHEQRATAVQSEIMRQPYIPQGPQGPYIYTAPTPSPYDYGQGRAWHTPKHHYGHQHYHGSHGSHGSPFLPPEPPKEYVKLFSEVKGTYESVEVIGRGRGQICIRRPGFGPTYDEWISLNDPRFLM